ncbi:glycine, alanine and asparagine-rich protein-like [Stomoxys calcitrans]|uniref:glycine, alanine and asparagine-rich protein-like n=1 Tax=Stomoxys calcitrans TaxID=35570 RepID=UPI0027E2790D|nr:glycine, alanine and asparagine-rich protein-like [Stomoxys calcitrans]
MRAFVVLCLVAVASAQYNYQPGSGGAGGSGGRGGNGGFGGNGGSGGIGGSGGLGGFGGNGLGGGHGGQGGFGSSLSGPSSGGIGGSGPSFGGVSSAPAFGGSSGPSFGGAGSAPSFGGSSGPVGSSSFEAPEAQGAVEKQFITYTADEQDFNDPQATEQFANSVKQGLRVVFIKGPDNSGLENAALALAKQAASQQTAIYVLNKQTDLAALANKLNAENSNSNNKPEVHFVKYRTPEDAANAQRAIQAEYDALGGKSQNIDGGVASSLNFASQAPFAPASQGSFGGNTKRDYLPASIFRRFR